MSSRKKKEPELKGFLGLMKVTVNQWFRVDAEDEDEARSKFKKMEGEYCHDSECTNWELLSVEEDE